MTYRSTEFTVDELGFIQIALNKVLLPRHAESWTSTNWPGRKWPQEAWISKATGSALIAPARSIKWR